MMEDEIAFNEQPNVIRRQALTNHNFTIISSNCIGAILYHELGQQFNSPTINLFIYPHDYLDLVTHLHEYMASNDWDEEQSEKKDYPVGILTRPGGSIRVYFVHYDNFNTAVKAWNRRRQRIDYDNIYYIMAEENAVTKEELIQFDQLPFKHKVLFTANYYPELQSAFWLKNCEIDGYLGEWYKADNYLGKLRIDNFDAVSFFNKR